MKYVQCILVVLLPGVIVSVLLLFLADGGLVSSV